MQLNNYLNKFHRWRLRHLSDRNFLMIMGIGAGLASGFAAVIIKNAVHFIQALVSKGTSILGSEILLITPAIGILLCMLFIKIILRRNVDHGIPSVLFALSQRGGRIKRHNTYSSIITSALTVGFGGSVGLEGPTVTTGAALGSNLGKALKLNRKQLFLILGCASAGALSAIFKAPIAAIVFALEVIMLDLTMSSLVPLLLASLAAVITSYLYMGKEVLYPCSVTQLFEIRHLPYYIGLGLLTGIISVYFTRTYMAVQGFFEKLRNWPLRWIIGVSGLGILLFLFPSLYGEGYNAINQTLKGDLSALYNLSLFADFKDNIPITALLLLLVVLFKVIGTSVTFGAGGIGGIFAPSLFIGAHCGMLLSIGLTLFGDTSISATNLALVGMAGALSGIIHAPLTAIFLIAEITGGYALFLPLMITSTISYAFTKFFESNSVYTIQLADRGELITHHKDKAVLTLLKVKNLIETNLQTVHPDATLGDLVKIVAHSKRNIFPVVDSANTFHGLVIMDDIRNIMFRPELYKKITINELMFMPTHIVSPHENMEEVATKFQQSGNYNLPVIHEGKYLGFVSRANVFSSYRNMLREISED